MTPDPSAAADTLRDELTEAIYQRRLQGSKVEAGPLLLKVLHSESFEFADAVLPVVRRHADAQVAAALAAVRALLDPDAEMATWVAGHRYFEEADIRRALDGVQP